MTVGELIEELRKHPVDAHVMVDDRSDDGRSVHVDVDTLTADVNTRTGQKFVILT